MESTVGSEFSTDTVTLSDVEPPWTSDAVTPQVILSPGKLVVAVSVSEVLVPKIAPAVLVQV